LSALPFGCELEPESGEPKKSSKETASCGGLDAAAAGEPDEASWTEAVFRLAASCSEAGEEAPDAAALPGGRADSRERKKVATDCPLVSRAEYDRRESVSGGAGCLAARGSGGGA
jgi:hypothetical protein